MSRYAKMFFFRFGITDFVITFEKILFQSFIVRVKRFVPMRLVEPSGITLSNNGYPLKFLLMQIVSAFPSIVGICQVLR